MIAGYLRGKLGRSGSAAHERGEDLLTSTVFGLLRYLPLQDGIVPVLQQARRVEVGSGGEVHLAQPGSLIKDEVLGTSYRFWPRLDKFGEPDLLLEIKTQNGTSHILLEVKLYSPKSGKKGDYEDGESENGENEDVEEPALPSRDQLARYWQALNGEDYRGTHCAIVYLTAHPTAPTEDLRSSLEEARSAELFWLSWFDVWAAINARPSSAISEDVSALLRYMRFNEFKGFGSSAIHIPQRAALWHNVWFGGGLAMASLPRSGRFWRTR